MSRDRALIDLAEAWTGRRAGRGPEMPVFCTVVGHRGSSYRKLGARALFDRAGLRAGTVSGGCLERDLVRRGAWLCERGPALVRYDATIEEAEEGGKVGLGCGGEVTILVERPVPDQVALEAIAAAALGGKASVLVTIVSAGPALGGSVAVADELTADARVPRERLSDLAAIARQARTNGPPRLTLSGDLELLVEVVRPPPSLLVCGGQDTAPLVSMARVLGWRVVVADPRVPISQVEHVQADAAVVMTHSIAADRRWLEALLPRTEVRYVGLLGPRERADHVVASLAAPAQAGLPKLRAPVGLDLGGEGPESIALAVVAELEAFRNGRAPSIKRPARAGRADRRALP
jgi:xanthine/CO dehydrogenase XdhC/CoxF family maturation factor